MSSLDDTPTTGPVISFILYVLLRPGPGDAGLGLVGEDALNAGIRRVDKYLVWKYTDFVSLEIPRAGRAMAVGRSSTSSARPCRLHANDHM